MAEEFIIKIVDDARRAVRGATGGGGNGSAGEATIAGKGGGLGSIAKLVGIANIGIAFLKMINEAIYSIFKPIKTIITGIFKLVAQLLRPIADLLIILLQPILLFLKPIIKSFNDIMRPFRQIAFKALKSSAQAGGRTTTLGLSFLNLAMESIFTGFATGLLEVIRQLLVAALNLISIMLQELILFPLLEIIRPVIEWFGGDIDKTKETIKKLMQGGIDAVSDKLKDGVDLLKDTSLDYLREKSVELNNKLQENINTIFNVNIPSGNDGSGDPNSIENRRRRFSANEEYFAANPGLLKSYGGYSGSF